MIPTIEVIGMLRVRGFVSVMGVQSRSRIEDRDEFQPSHNDRAINATYQIMNDAPKTLDTIQQWKQITLSRPQQLAMAEAAMEINPNAAIKSAFLLSARREEDMTAADASRDLWRTTHVLQDCLNRGGAQGGQRPGSSH